MASLARLFHAFPVPVFGSVHTATAFLSAKARTLPRFAGWIVPLGAGALWFVWPAVDDGWKISVGILADPEAAAAEASKASKLEAEEKKLAQLSPAAVAKVETAFKAHHGHEPTKDDEILLKAAKTGDYTLLEEKWEAFVVKSTNPGEDDEEEEEEEEEEAEEEEEEEEEEE